MAGSKSKGLWDTDEEDVVLGVRSKAVAKSSAPARSKPSLFDSDEGEDIFPSKPAIATKVSKLFDEDSSPEKLSPKTDYKQLYESELARRMELEVLVAKLQTDIATLRSQLLTESSEQLSDQDSVVIPNARDAEWDALAKEEKLRRQRAIQQKASRHRSVNISKRVVSAQNVEAAEASVGVSSALPGKAVQVGHYLDSDEGEDLKPVAASASLSITASASASASLDAVEPARSISPVPRLYTASDKEDEPEPEAEADTDVIEDAEAAKWRELAAQEKARKALARRSVRVVRRGPGALAAGASAASGSVDSADGTAKPKHLLLSAHIKNSGSMHNLTVATNINTNAAPTSSASTPRTTISGSVGNSIGIARVSPVPRAALSDSDWDSNSSDEEERTVAAQVAVPQARPPLSSSSVCSSVAGSRSVSPMPGANNGGASRSGDSHSSGSGSAGEISAEEEAALDRRLRAWAAGRSTAQLLCSVPSAVQHAAAVLLEGGEVSGAAQGLSAAMAGNNGQAQPSDVRKAYMRVIRVCHPDKHMQLPPRSRAFLELQKIFTVLSDSYNRYKAAQA